MKIVSKFALSLTLTVLIIGCRSTSGSKDSVSLKELSPTAKLPEQANLVLAGTKIPVELLTRQTGKDFVIELTAFGEILETEHYRMEADRFELVEVLGEVYAPAMPILRSEMKVNSPWKWNGQVSAAGIRHGVSAEIFLKSDTEVLFAQDSKALIVTATLTIDAGDQTTAERVLRFYFVPGKGLVSREFGLASSRVPVASKPTSGKISEK